jgi:hypothetical protein
MREEAACGSNELDRPLSSFRLRGKPGRAGSPTPEARYAPAKSAGTLRCCRLPTRGLPPLCVSPAASQRGKNLTDRGLLLEAATMRESV